MQQRENRDALDEVIQKSYRKCIGKVKGKELRPNLLVNNLFKAFSIKNKAQPNLSEGKLKVEIQELAHSCLREPIGMFHIPEFDEDGFLHRFTENYRIQ